MIEDILNQERARVKTWLRKTKADKKRGQDFQDRQVYMLDNVLAQIGEIEEALMPAIEEFNQLQSIKTNLKKLLDAFGDAMAQERDEILKEKVLHIITTLQVLLNLK